MQPPRQCLGPPLTPTQHTIFVNLIGCVVVAVVEQVYSDASNLQQRQLLKCFTFASKCVCWPSSSGTTEGAYSAPQLRSKTKGEGKGIGGEREGEEGKGQEASQCRSALRPLIA